MDATNRLDPASKNLNLQVGNIPSNSQSYFVDTSLLEEVRVYDSFVPAEYGRFTGGVVDARLRRYSGENHLSLDYRWNTSKMTQQKVAEARKRAGRRASLATRRNGKALLLRRGGSGFQRKVRRGPGGIASPIRHHALEHGRGRQGQPLPGQDNYRDQIDNFLGSSACAPARGPRPTWCSNTATARKRWSATSSAKPAGTTTMRRAASASTSTTSSRAGAIRCRPAGTARSATAYRSATSWSLSSPGACRNTRRAASARNRSSRTAGPSRAASTWIRCAPAQSRTSPTPAWNGSGCRPGSNASSNRIPTAAPTTTRAATRISARSATCPAPWT